MPDVPVPDVPVPAIVAGAAAREVDATGLSCPMPVIELARTVGEVEVGDLVRLAATDPAARVDVPVWCRMQRHRLRASTEQQGTWWFLVERSR